MKLAIVGSRTFDDVRLFIESIPEKSEIEMIISGGANGADLYAEKYAEIENIPLKIFKPQWDVYGKKAGMLRNSDIVNECDKLIAFWDGKSKGTLDSITKAKTQDKLLKIVRFDVSN